MITYPLLTRYRYYQKLGELTNVEQALADLLKPYGFKITNNRYGTEIDTIFSNNTSATIYITGTRIILRQWGRGQYNWDDIFTDLCDPNSLKIIEDWAKTP